MDKIQAYHKRLKTVTKALPLLIVIFTVTASIAYSQQEFGIGAGITGTKEVSLLVTNISVIDLSFETAVPGTDSNIIKATSTNGGKISIYTNQIKAPVTITWLSLSQLNGPGAATLAFNEVIKGGTISDGAGAVILTSGMLQPLSGTGEYYIFVGGTLGNGGTIPAGQIAGSYSGSIRFTISTN